jgi:hypothetical protein
MTRAAALFLLVTVLVATRAGADEARRWAIAVGANAGDPSEVTLRYAGQDARRVARVLRDVGGFAPEDVLVLTGVDAEELRRALISVNARIRSSAGGSLLFVYYSGHADAEALHLGGTRLPLSELRDLVTGSPARAGVLVIDACRSGALTRVKGGHQGPSFDIRAEHRLQEARGTAFLTSSAAGEDAQESDRLGGSFFTHYFVSALLGAADANGDGAVTLGEAFAYASERTVAATATTVSGPQHPTYGFHLSGRDDLVLSRPATGRRRGLVELAEPGTYLFQRGGLDGRVVAEVASPSPGRRVALVPDRYAVTFRGKDHLRQGKIAVGAGGTTVLRASALRRVDYARVVRKGGTERRRAASIMIQGGARGGLLDLGAAWRGDLVTRVDFAPLSLELRIGAGFSAQSNQRLNIDTRELATSVAALRAFDLGPLTLSLGFEAGVGWISQAFHDPQTPDRDGTAIDLGPVVQLEIPLGGRYYLRADVAALTYFLRTGNKSADVHWETPVTYRALFGVGIYF